MIAEEQNMAEYNVSVGITSYGGEPNIRQMLASLIAQKEDGFHIGEILFISDGSPDMTAELARGIGDARMKISDDKHRLGQSRRLNELIQKFQGDILVFLDDDIILQNEYVLKNLIEAFRSNPTVVLAGGNPQPLPPVTFFGGAVNNLHTAFNLVRKNWKAGKNPFGFYGCCLALRRDFAKSLQIPEDVIGDSFMYFTAVVQGLKFIHVQGAVVWIRCVQTIHDQIVQGTRFLAQPLRLQKYFARDIIKREYSVPLRFRIRIFLSQIFKNPLGYIVLKFVGIYCSLKSRNYVIGPTWQIAKSSKILTRER